jgi:hypothetical protein
MFIATEQTVRRAFHAAHQWQRYPIIAPVQIANASMSDRERAVAARSGDPAAPPNTISATTRSAAARLRR